MNWRIFAIGLAVVGALGFNSFLIATEQVVAADAKTMAEQKKQDELYGMRFNPAEREGNFRKMGFDAEEIKDQLLKRIATLEEKYRVKDPQYNQILVKIDASDDPELTPALCGSNTDVPVRYGALPYLVQDKDGVLKAVDVEEISSFQYGDWAKRAQIKPAYAEGDITKDRKEDATRMVLAAILARDEATLIEHASPWGGGFIGGGWSWENVQKKHKGVNIRLYEYVSLMHLVLETALAEGGFCSA